MESRILLMIADRKFGRDCALMIKKKSSAGLLKLVGVVSENSFEHFLKKSLDPETFFLNNSERREEQLLKKIIDLKINIIVSIAHPWIISRSLIEAVKGCAFNIHFGKLPDYRGHHTHIFPILNGEKAISTTFHWMAPEVDRGFLAWEEINSIEQDDTAFDLGKKAIKSCSNLCNKFIEHILDSGLNNLNIPKKSILGKGKFFHVNEIQPLKRIESISNFTEVDRKSRAFFQPPHEPAFFELNGKKFYVLPKNSFKSKKQ